MCHNHPSLILLKPGEHHPRWIQMLSGWSEAVGLFSKSCAAQFFFILCKSIVFYFMKEFIYFCDLALRVFSQGVPSCSQEPVCQRKHRREHRGSAGAAVHSHMFGTNKVVNSWSLQPFKAGLFPKDCWHNRTTSLNTVFIAIYPFYVLHTGCI